MSTDRTADRRLRRAVPGVTLAAAVTTVLALPLTALGLLQAPAEPLAAGQIVWLLFLCVALHATGFLCARHPGIAFITGSALMSGLALTIVPGIGSAALLPSGATYLLLLWRLASVGSRRRSIGGLATGLTGAVVIAGVNTRVGPTEPLSFAVEAGGLMAAIVAGWALGTLARQGRLDEERRAEESMQQAVAQERARIRRDLHDVVSHSLTVMIAQAEAARVTPGAGPADASLERIAETGREAMRGLRGMIDTLDDPDATALTPVAGVDALAELIDNARSP